MNSFDLLNTNKAPSFGAAGNSALGSSPMNLLPQTPATQPGQPALGGFLQMLQALGAQQPANPAGMLGGMMGNAMSGQGFTAQPNRQMDPASGIAALMRRQRGGGLF